MKLPDDMFSREILSYLTVHDIVRLDNACMNYKYRFQLLDKIRDVILIGDEDKSMKTSLFKWLGMRRIYLIKMSLYFKDNSSFSSSIEHDYVDQFRYTQHVLFRGFVRDATAIFIISHCPSLLSIGISGNYVDCRYTTDHTLKSIAEHCNGRLQSLSLSGCIGITDTGMINILEHCSNLLSLTLNGSRVYRLELITDASIISLSSHCTGLQSLDLYGCQQITDASIISISTNCTGLQSLNLRECNQITDTSIISLSTHCTGLQSLNLVGCKEFSDASIISISTHCIGLQSLDLAGCRQITDASIISISFHCTKLQSLNLNCCRQITDTSIISLSTHCTGLKRLSVSYTAITDASLIAIAKNCTGLQSLNTYECNRLSSSKLRGSFITVSDLRKIPPRRACCTIH
jgi:hypothetical protein